MTVKDEFELRKEGRVEEAYNAIMPMYKEHHGHYTTLCMFWCGCDMAKLHINRGNSNDALRILQSLARLYPDLEDKDLNAKQTLLNIAVQLAKADKSFSLLDFMQWWGIENLKDVDFEAVQSNGHPVPSRGQRIASRIFHEVKDCDEMERVRIAMPYIDLALLHTPHNRNLKRAKALLLAKTGKKEQAVAIYCELARYGKEAYIFSELAALTDDKKEKLGLICKAITLQRSEAFRQKDRLRLAELLQDVRPRMARYEVDQCVRVREANNQHNNRHINVLLRKLQNVAPASAKEQQEFYRKAIDKLLLPLSKDYTICGKKSYT
ncbi:MAG: acetyltransferase [Paludibacteraceae bacterium]|nr:acetyltransferase [Paludibacteraceae bacterium]